MGHRQREFYQRWVAAWKTGTPLAVDGNFSYLLCYAFELLARGPHLARKKLAALAEAYAKSEPKFSACCQGWVSDCYVASGEYKKALDLFPRPPVDSCSRSQTDSLLSLKLKVGSPLEGRDLLTLCGPKTTSWGRQHLSEIAKYVDAILTARRGNNECKLLNSWANPRLRHQYPVFSGFKYFHASQLTAYSFSLNKRAVQFATTITREAENTVREEMDMPLVGEGWLAETDLFYKIKMKMEGYDVIHHARPNWLQGQHLDIFIPPLNVAVEFQGAQHDKAIAYFGGESAFDKQRKRDRRKARLCLNNGVRLIYVRPGYSLPNVLKELLTF
ncbi:MAG: hypothetical protein HYR83_00770 [Planctomycetes bacterium]|nr:hypothetical protein [Planctomycetota bacterium]